MQTILRAPLVTPAFSKPIHPVIQRVLAARGVSTDAELELSLATMLAPDQLLDIGKAVALLYRVLTAKQRLLIVADFDADGATSCALAVSALGAMGFTDIHYLVPNRFEFGYGLTPEIVDVAVLKSPHVLMTVDNGIASHEGVSHARKLGMDVLVTDHHLPADTAPDASCIINPNQHGCTFPSKALAGVGVVFYLLVALRAFLREQNWFSHRGITEPNLTEYLDLVALGTVADVVPLDTNNRRLVRHGLAIIRRGKARPGIRALLEVAGKNCQSIVASDLGFAAGPRLNAAGRLDDMSVGIECLLAQDDMTAMRLARELDGLNRDRKLIEQEMLSNALMHLDAMTLDAGSRSSICLYDPAWHQGVIGILASRIKDRLHLPAIVFAQAGESALGEPLIKGSARSITGIHIRDMLDAVATRYPRLLSKFGGHAMAAGLTIRQDDYPAFTQALDEQISQLADPECFQREILFDGELEQDCFSLEFAQTLRFASPWGQHFPEPIFAGEFEVISSRVLGGKHLKLVLMLPGSNEPVDAIAFNQDAAILEQSLAKIRLLYKLDVNEFRGNCAVQLLIENLEIMAN